MKAWTKKTVEILKFNQKQALFFEVLYRLLTGPLYLLLLNKGIQFSLKMAGYSYLTAGNVGYFFLQPWTVVTILALGAVGIIFLAFETGCLLTLFQGAAYHRKLGMAELLTGGFEKLWDEIRKKNWQLGLLILCGFGLMNFYVIFRVLTHVKPVNFVLSEMMKQPWGRLLTVTVTVALVLFAVPGMYTAHACMIEQKNFRDGYHRSRKLLGGHILPALGTALGANLLVTFGFHIVYAFCVLIAAVGMTVFTDSRLALAVLPAVCDRIEMVLLMVTGMTLSLVNFGVLSVQYYQYKSRMNHGPGWDFEYPKRKSAKGRMAGAVVAVMAAVSLFFLFDVMKNGSALGGDILTPVQITAHRGSSKEAPENTMAAVAAAVDDVADFVEIDVQNTSDGVAVLGHDSALKRVAGVNRSISSYTFGELQQLDVGRWFSDRFQGERIPSLAQVMEYCKGRVNMNIEIKNVGKDSTLPDQVVELIHGFQMEEQCVVTSTRLSYLKRVRELDPDIRTGYIISAAYGDYYSSGFIDFISIRSSFVTENLVKAAHEKGKAIHAWTVNTKSEMERMKMLGVDNVITDYPVLAREIIYREEATENLLEYLQLIFH